ncbi:Plasmodium exported protein, unknown function [Plasmodium gonderi]|uniref:Uncharacterized protein n=1 Tax=Plasmodium gonderi TaxID=77519 RepID=A0A1Y1JRU2_PLAGO|nr:Plasmodium exported protein, unknown function [Plasmodium gonderi]GAW82724.1 Plasmodium exported protein, unknown function [Plasmodium gonderi]
MYFCNHLEDYSKLRSKSVQVKNALILESSTATVKSKSKNMKTLMIAFFVNIISLTFLFWTHRFSFDCKDINKYSTYCKNTFNGKGTHIIYKRSIAEYYIDSAPEEIQENSLEQQDESENTLEFYNSNYSLEENDIDDSETLEELIENSKKEFDNMMADIANRYEEFTDHMNHYWCDKMWKTRWCKYAEGLYSSITKNLYDSTLILDEKKKLIKIMMEWCESDFKLFLKMIKEEWDLRDDPEHYLER